MNSTRLLTIFMLSLAAPLAHSQSGAFSFDTLFARYSPLFDSVIQHKDNYRIQLLYTRIDRDANNVPNLTTYSYDADKYYYYCASMVKLPACVLTLEKINNLAACKVDMLDSLGVDSIGCTELTPQSMMLGTPYSCLGHYIKEMLMLSNNHAFNPVYDFLGQQYFQDRLHQIGLNSAVISNRFAACDTTANRLCDPISLFDRHTHQLKYYQPCINNERRQFYNGDLNPQIGIGYLDAADHIINQPKDFRFANYVALSDLHKFLTKVMLPETQQPSEKLNLTRRDYQYLYKCMGMFPRESAYPTLDSIHYPDRYMKYFMGNDTNSHVMPDNIRIFNKVGQAYGFMTDCSYVVDTLNKVEFFLSCAMYLNADGILNDGVYEYDQIGFPFFKNLFNTIYEQELTRPKQHIAHLELPDFSDTLLVKPAPPYWLKVDTARSIPEMEAILCRLADSMWADSRLFINYDKIKSDEIFYRNLTKVLKSGKSEGYPFENLQRKNISIYSSDDGGFRVFSWNRTGTTNTTIFQLVDNNGNITIKKPEDFNHKSSLLPLDYTQVRIIQIPISREEDPDYIYLLLTKTISGSADYLQAFGWFDSKPILLDLFQYNSYIYSQILAEKRNDKDHIVYNERHKTIIFPMIIKKNGKTKTRNIKLKFDGYVFRSYK